MGKTLAFRRTLYYNVKYGIQKSPHNIHDTKHNMTLYKVLCRGAAEVIGVCPANHILSGNVSPAHTPVLFSVLPHLSISKGV